MVNFVFPFFLAVLGASVGSFLHATALRIGQKMPFVRSRSACPHCHKILRWFHLIPLFSYLFQKGKCSYCDEPIAISYFVAEVALFFLFFIEGIIWQTRGLSMLVLIRDLLTISVLAYLFIYDLKYYLLPDVVTIPALVVIALFNLWIGMPWSSLLLGIVVGGGFFLLQFLLSKGKWIGGGDIRMGALLGALVGWPLILVALMLSYVGGTVVVLPLLLTGKKKMGGKIPFGTFLAIGGTATLWWGSNILNWFLSLL